VDKPSQGSSNCPRLYYRRQSRFRPSSIVCSCHLDKIGITKYIVTLFWVSSALYASPTNSSPDFRQGVRRCCASRILPSVGASNIVERPRYDFRRQLSFGTNKNRLLCRSLSSGSSNCHWLCCDSIWFARAKPVILCVSRQG
jgi:hypothetical protein